MTPPFRIAALAPDHDRTAFSCGVEALDRYLRLQATQDVRRRIANCFVAIAEGTPRVAGYYTLASTGIPLVDLPPAIARKLPRYPSVPAALIGRLAVDREFRGRQLGAALLADAAVRVSASATASFTLLVEAKDGSAASFYARHGFVAFASRPSLMFLPLATARQLLS